ncbi:LOW QUALITY PROTEIN: Peptidase_S10 domain-containing protein, partial [Cephalotus follicularis]
LPKKKLNHFKFSVGLNYPSCKEDWTGGHSNTVTPVIQIFRLDAVSRHTLHAYIAARSASPLKLFHLTGLHFGWSASKKMAPQHAPKHCQKKTIHFSISCVSLMCLHVLLLVLFSAVNAESNYTVVTQLPGFDGDLPFYLETGYVGVGESNESQMFYYFVESQRSSSVDPLMLWLTGGPGCSVLSAFFYESGPVTFDYKNYNGSLPSLQLNEYAWTQSINILYVDAPVGTGFSYSTTAENYYTNDTKSASETYEFLRKWLIDHPQYLTNQLFIGGDSYSGIPLPIVVQNIIDGNKAGLHPTMNLKGYILGNPKTDDFIDENSLVPFAHRLTLISNQLYQAAKEDCGGDVNINASNTACVQDIDYYDEMVLEINMMQVLEANCQVAAPKKRGEFPGRRSLKDEPVDFPISLLSPAYWCREYNYVLSAVWANYNIVREALHVRENTIGVWKRCNSSIAYTKTVTSSVAYHRNLSTQSLRAIVYSGDHDFSVPYIGTYNWIQSLDLTTYESWRPWFVDGQVAG